MPRFYSTLALAAMLLMTTALSGGCQSYTAPGGAADMSAFRADDRLSELEREQHTDAGIREALDRKPLARFPVNLAVARVQASGYRSHTATGYGKGRYSVVTTRDVEADDAYARIAGLPMIEGVAPVGRLLLPRHLNSDEELRAAAADLRANMLLIYTFDTHIYVGDTDSPIDVLTLGFLPNKKAEVATTASALLLDTRNGYVYGLTEASARTTQRANTWTRRAAVDQSRQRTEAEAFEKLVDAFADTWQGVLSQYHPAATSQQQPPMTSP
ncbi:MAG: hypothetical protein WD534_16475 [Phycisphaeraceae bacterium]